MEKVYYLHLLSLGEKLVVIQGTVGGSFCEPREPPPQKNIP